MLSDAYTTRQVYGEKPGPGEPLSLSIVVGTNAFMYAIFAQQYKKVAELGHVYLAQATALTDQVAEKVPALVQNFFLHQKKFEKVNIAVLSRQFALVPDAYGQGDLKALLHFTTGIDNIRTAQRHQVKGISVCYTPDPELVSYFERTFSNASIRHAVGISLSLLFSQHSLAACQVFLNIGDADLELAIKDKNELKFYNLFHYETNEDILYYLLFTLECFQLDPLLVKLCLAGQRPVTDDLVKNIKRYIRQVSFCVPDPSLQLSGELAQLPEHYYFTLLNQHLCEL